MNSPTTACTGHQSTAAIPSPPLQERGGEQNPGFFNRALSHVMQEHRRAFTAVAESLKQAIRNPSADTSDDDTELGPVR
ncbi:MAG: hypothetical protein KDI44_01070 [Thiothrix sp.]|nr:hypothetical protein [Thiothrix sp.]HPQ95441.1 hypothetical protein [Thiolinea sp.]